LAREFDGWEGLNAVVVSSLQMEKIGPKNPADFKKTVSIDHPIL
jgi:hypothetical protein